MELLDLPAHALIEQMKARRLSPVEVVEAHIAQIEATHPLLNARVEERYAEARREAREAEARAARGEAEGALFGLPVTIKEFFAVAGMKQTGGIWARRERRAEADAPTVARLRAAGAILLCTSNVPEGGLWMEATNPVYGRTNNPWDLSRTSGGSSGGEGALVGAGCSPLGLGSDVGGSIRIPAAFCGTAGHKPGLGLVPTSGHFPPAMGEVRGYLGAGPLARRVADLSLALSVLAGPDASDPLVAHTFEHRPFREELKGLRVHALMGDGRTGIRPVMKAGVERAVGALLERGARREELVLPGLERSFEIWSAALSLGAEEHYDKVLGDGEPIAVWTELAKLCVGRSQHSFPGLTLAALDVLTAKLPIDAAGLVALGRRIQADLEAALGTDGVLIYPPYSRPAPRHSDAWRTPFDPACTAIFNILQLPVTVVPVGWDRRGLPICVQVIGSRGQDRLTLEAAAAIEAATGGWRRPRVQARPAAPYRWSTLSDGQLHPEPPADA